MAKIGWLSGLGQAERKAFWACVAGWSLDAFDSQMFGLAIPALIAAIGLTRGQAGLITSATLVASALGGWIGGVLSDRWGRVRVLRLSVLWFALGSGLAALCSDFHLLIVVKAVQGLGFGAEWSAGAALIASMIAPERRGRAMAGVQSGWALGWGGAVLVFALAFSWFRPETAWRIVFAIGLIPALFVLVVQRGLQEPPRSTARSAGADNSAVGIFRPENLRGTLAGALLGVGAHGGYYGLFTWLPTFLKTERHLTVINTGAYLATIIVAFGLGCLAAGQMLDRLGRRPSVAIFAAGCIAIAVIYLIAPIPPAMMLALGAPLGFFAAGIPASMGALFSDLYPDGIRGSGLGFCYNFGRIASAAFPAVIGAMGERMPLGLAIGVDAGLAYALVLVALLILPPPVSSLTDPAPQGAPA